MVEEASGKILVVDDEKDVLKVNRILLEKGGYAVETATSGAEALEKASAGGTSLIVLDLTMPGLDAYSLCERLSSDSGAAKIPMLILADMEDAAEKLLNKVSAAGDYITKPTKKEAFLEKVRALIGKPGSAPEGGRPAQGA